jgi:hypothetical protein
MNRQQRKQSINLIHNSLEKKKKYLGINLTKEVKDFYNDNYKTLKKTPEDRKTSNVHGWEELIL